jgi:hypothetical protein
VLVEEEAQALPVEERRDEMGVSIMVRNRIEYRLQRNSS